MTPNTAIQLTYLVTGIDAAVRDFHQANPGKDHPMTAAGGHIGMVCKMLPYAEDVTTALDAGRRQDFPGVFVYEVTEELGAWMGRQAVQPTRAEFGVELTRSISDYFNQ